MKPVSRLSIRCAFGSLSKSMSLLLLTPLLLALAQPIASQVYVNSSTYNDNTRSPADQTQESLRPSPPTGRTDVLDESNYQRPKTEELTNRIASVGDYEEGKPTLNGQPKAINNNTVEKILMKPSKIYTEVDLTTQSLSPNNRTERGLGRTQHTTMKPVTKVPTQKTGGYSENEATTFISIKQHFGETTIADAVHKKAIPDTSEEDLKSMSEVSLPTAVSLASTDSSTDSDHTDDAQMSHTFLTTESTTHIKTTVGLVLQARISTATVANKKQLTSVNFPGVAHWMNMSGADLGAKHGNTSETSHQTKESQSLNGNTTGSHTNMTHFLLRTPPQRETTANLTTPQPKSTTQLASTTKITNQKSEGAAAEGGGPTTRSQQRAEIKTSKSTTKQQSTAGRSQSKMTLVGFGCVRKQWLH